LVFLLSLFSWCDDALYCWYFLYLFFSWILVRLRISCFRYSIKTLSKWFSWFNFHGCL
jgi:hypothetical protein